MASHNPRSILNFTFSGLGLLVLTCCLALPSCQSSKDSGQKPAPIAKGQTRPGQPPLVKRQGAKPGRQPNIASAGTPQLKDDYIAAADLEVSNEPDPSAPPTFRLRSTQTPTGIAKWMTKPSAVPTGQRASANRDLAARKRTSRQRISTDANLEAKFTQALMLGGNGFTGPFGTGNGRDLVLHSRLGTKPFNATSKVIRAGDTVDLMITSPGGTMVGAPILLVIDVIRPEPWMRLSLPQEDGVLGISHQFRVLLQAEAQNLGAQGFVTSVDTSTLPELGLGTGLIFQAAALDNSAPNGIAITPSIECHGSWPLPQSTLQANNLGTTAIFGESSFVHDVNGDGHNDLIVGAAKATFPGETRVGAVIVFFGPSLQNSTTLKSPTPSVDGYFGRDVTAGDVTGDGIVDIIVGARAEVVAGATRAGSVYVFPGPAFTSPQRIVEPTPEPSARFGHCVTLVDWTGDGIKDIAIGAHKATSGGGMGAGEVYIFAGPTFASHQRLDAPVATGGARFGYGIAAGDFNQNGGEDLIIGAPFQDVGPNGDNTGVVYVFMSPSGTPAHTLSQDEDALAYLGHEVDVADVNNDGHDDIIAAAEFDDEVGPNAGSVHIFYGPQFSTSDELVSPDPQVDGAFGSDIDVGDTNGDGHVDIAVGEMWANPDGTRDRGGRAWVFLGPTFNLALAIDPLPGGQSSWTGRRMTMGDLNGVPGAEVIVGAPFTSVPGVGSNAGCIYIYQ